MALGVRLRGLSVWFLSVVMVIGVFVPAHADPDPDPAPEPDLVATLTAENTPRFAAISPDGTRLYVSNTGSRSLTVFDTSTRVAVGRLDLPTNVAGTIWQLVVSPDGNTVYLGRNGSGTNYVWKIDVRNDAPVILDTISVATDLRGIAVSPDGQKLYGAHYIGNKISVIRTSDNTVTEIPNPASGLVGQNFSNPDQVIVSPDGQYFYVSYNKGSAGSGAAGVVRFRTSDNAVDQFRVFSENIDTSISAKPFGLALSSDGRYLYVSDYGTGPRSGVGKYDLTATNWLETPLARINISSAGYIALSADDSLLFVSDYHLSNTRNVKVVDTAGNTIIKTVDVTERATQVVAHPSRNARQAFVGSRSATGDVYLVGYEAVPEPESAAASAGGALAVPAIGMALEAQVGSTINGRSVSFTIQRMAAVSSYSLTLQPNGNVVAEGVVGPSGNASGTPVLEGITPGSYQVVLVGTGPDGKNYRLEQSFVVGDDFRLVSISDPVGSVSGGATPQVQATAPAERLAYTGVPATQLPTWALVFLGLGFALVLYSVRARRMVDALAVVVDAPAEKTPWEVLATPIRVPGIDYMPGSEARPGLQAVPLSETLRELDIALSRLLVRNIDRFALPAFRGF